MWRPEVKVNVFVFLGCIPPYCSDTGSLTGTGPFLFCKTNDQRVLGVFYPLLQHQADKPSSIPPAFYVGVGDLSSGPHPCMEALFLLSILTDPPVKTSMTNVTTCIGEHWLYRRSDGEPAEPCGFHVCIPGCYPSP